MQPELIDFNSKDVDKYIAAFNQAKNIVSKAYSSANSLQTMNKASDAYKDVLTAFKRFWGDNKPEIVAKKLKSLKEALISKPIQIKYDPKDTSSKAYVFCKDCATSKSVNYNPVMHFCQPLIADYSVLGTNSAAGTIIHELSHLVLGTDDKIYGMNSCSINLSDVDKLVNADNYKYYCELFQLARLSLMPELSDSYDLSHKPPR
ncbi:M35 family metallo-endopeptidase [Microcoleus sp. CAWBG640]|uniref:M35 family metallo-endopeptidase n=1 Tax=Microcoleus sp. CAWBG640 TaxID=2841653 RepID=UPI00312BC456